MILLYGAVWYIIYYGMVGAVPYDGVQMPLSHVRHPIVNLTNAHTHT